MLFSLDARNSGLPCRQTLHPTEGKTAMGEVEYVDDYINLFDPHAYMSFNDTWLNNEFIEGDIANNHLQFVHEAFADNSIKGRRLLDIGTGPCVYSLISASPHVDSIFLSDIAPQNIEILKKWLNGTLKESFEMFFRFFVDLEGKGESPSDRERSLREKISGICSIDMRQENPFGASFFPRFDVIISSLCLEVAARNLTEYEQIARRVSDMLQDGGHLLLFGVLGEKFYKVGHHSFRCLEINADQVQDTWKKSGFKIKSWEARSSSVSGKDRISDFQGYFHMVARKEL